MILKEYEFTSASPVGSASDMGSEFYNNDLDGLRIRNFRMDVLSFGLIGVS
jgi:hypothetical protein